MFVFIDNILNVCFIVNKLFSNDMNSTRQSICGPNPYRSLSFLEKNHALELKRIFMVAILVFVFK